MLRSIRLGESERIERGVDALDLSRPGLADIAHFAQFR